MALIYRALYQGPDLRRVELKGFLEELIAQLIVADQDSTGSIRTELHADDLVIHPDKLAPLALFAVEAIANAQKHAFAANRARGASLSGWMTRSSACSSVRIEPVESWSATISWAISSSRKPFSYTRLRSAPW